MILDGNLSTSFESRGRVYDINGIAPTIVTTQEQNPKIIERRSGE